MRVGLSQAGATPARCDDQGASCSAACAVFFKADPMAITKNRHTGLAGPDRQVALFQQRLQLGECQMSGGSAISSTLASKNCVEAPSIRPDRRSPPLG